MKEKELTQEELSALAQKAVEEVEAAAEAAAQQQEEEAPPLSTIIIEFNEVGSSQSRLLVQGQVTPDQLALAGMRLLNQAWNIWGSPMVESIVAQVVNEVFKQMRRQAQEEQVRHILRGAGRGAG